MDNKDFIARLSVCTGFAEEDTVRMVHSLVDCMAQALQEGKGIQIQDFGLFEVQKELEYISVNPLTKQRFLIPPCLRLAFIPEGVFSAEQISQKNRIALQHLVDWLVKEDEVSAADEFVSAFFRLIKEGMQRDKYVKVKGLGAFKMIAFDAKTEAPIPSCRSGLTYGGVSFSPDSLLRDLINKPFAHFEIVPLKENVAFSDLPEVSMHETDTEVEDQEEETLAEEVCGCSEQDDKPVEGAQSSSEENLLSTVSVEQENVQQAAPVLPSQDVGRGTSAKRIPWCMFACALLVGAIIGGGTIWSLLPSRHYISEVINQCWEQQTRLPVEEEKETTSETDTVVVETSQAEQETISAVSVAHPKEVSPSAVQQQVLSDEIEYAINGTQCIHSLRTGESLTKIALRYYGNKKLWPYLVRHNREIIKNPDNIAVGTSIQIPVLVPKE